jgi:hypothetical protein
MSLVLWTGYQPNTRLRHEPRPYHSSGDSGSSPGQDMWALWWRSAPITPPTASPFIVIGGLALQAILVGDVPRKLTTFPINWHQPSPIMQYNEMLRIPYCIDNRPTNGGKVVSPTHRPHFTPQKYYFSASGTGWVNQRLVRAEIMWIEREFMHPIGSRTRDFPDSASNTTQPRALPVIPILG